MGLNSEKHKVEDENERKKKKSVESEREWDVAAGMAVFGEQWAQSLAVRAKRGF